MSQSKLKLVKVQVIARHGARTPFGVIPGLWPEDQTQESHSWLSQSLHLYEPESQLFFRKEVQMADEGPGFPRAYLTNIGHKTSLEIGLRLRKKYFESLIKDTTEVYARSTDISRTMQTLQRILQGLFHPTLESPNPTSFLNPIPIHTVEDHCEYLFPQVRHGSRLANLISLEKSCSRYTERELQEDIELKKRQDPEAKEIIRLRSLVTPHSWAKKSIDNHILELCDYLECLRKNGGKLPPTVTPRVVEELWKMAFWRVFSIFEGNDEICRLCSGKLIEELVSNFLSDKYKMYIYAGHDTTIIPLLFSLKVFDGAWPQFSANVIFEMYEDEATGKKYIQLIYNGKELKFPFADAAGVDPLRPNLCSLERFIESQGLMNCS